MKVMMVLCVLVWPCAAKKELTWTPAVVESSSRKLYSGGSVSGSTEPTLQSIRESIYLDAGAWLYHVTQIVTARGALNLPDGARVEVAEDGKQLMLRVGGKEHKLRIEERSRGKAKEDRPQAGGDRPGGLSHRGI
jgi:hypothetical protein